MRRFPTALLVGLVCAVAVAALVDALRGGPSSAPAPPEARREAAAPTAGSPAPEPPLPRCREEQLALALEELGGDNAVVLRHVQGGPCRLPGVQLEVVVTDRDGERSEVPLGTERELEGDYSPGFERVVRFSLCGEGAPFVATATAGPYSAEGPVSFGGGNCVFPARPFEILFEEPPDATRLHIQALDPTSHTSTVRIDVPHRTRIRVSLQTASGLDIIVLDAARREECRRRGRRDLCVVRYGLLPNEAAGEWTVLVSKLSRGAALVRVSMAFDPVG